MRLLSSNEGKLTALEIKEGFLKEAMPRSSLMDEDTGEAARSREDLLVAGEPVSAELQR